MEGESGIVRVLRALAASGAAGPGDLVSASGLPRYRVLAVVRCLEEMGLVEVIYSKGSYRVYRVSDLGVRLLRALEAGASLVDVIEEGVSAARGVSVSGVGEAGVEGVEASG